MKWRPLPANKSQRCGSSLRNAAVTLTTFLLAMALLSACMPAVPTPGADLPTVTTVPAQLPPTATLPTPALPTPDPTSEPTSAPSAADPPIPLPDYTLTATYAYTHHTLTVSELIEYTSPASQPLDQLLLIVEANRYDGSLSIQSLTIGGQALTDYTQEGNRLTMPLPRVLDPGELLSLAIEYTLVLPEIPEPSDTARPQPYGFTLRQANLVDWYPYIPPYQDGTGWIAPEPGYFGEHQVLPLANFTVTLIVPEIGVPLTVAASDPADQQGDTYRYNLPAARSFALSISPLYEVLSGSVDGVTVSSYCFTYDTYGGQAALDHTLRALALYQELFGPYPRAALSIVQADFLDGMEFDGLYFLSRGFYNTYDGSPAGYLTAIAVHETAHQWWYGLVGNNQATEPWLDEALCTYMERLYYERYYPDLLSWWWAYRVDLYEPTGAIDYAIYDYPTFRAYRDSVYLNGARFLEALRQKMGDEAFFTALRAYADRYRGSFATTPDLLNTFGAHTNQDLTPILEAYLK